MGDVQSVNALHRASLKDKIQVACVGDSITYGYDLDDRSRWSYPAQLQNMLGSSYNVMNFGHSGRTAMKDGCCVESSVAPLWCEACGKRDCSYWDSPKYQEALLSNADIVVMMLGTNDAKTPNWHQSNASGGAATEKDYMELAHSFRNLSSKPKLLLGVPIPLYTIPKGDDADKTQYPFCMEGDVVCCELPAMVSRVASAIGADGVVMTHDAVIRSGGNRTLDGCHPREEGYTTIAKAFEEAILALKKQ